jgi:hypothetical protein
MSGRWRNDTKSKVAGEEREERERRTLDQEIGKRTRAGTLERLHCADNVSDLG